MKKISDYIVSFAFLYSSFYVFDKSIDVWISNKYLAILCFFVVCCPLYAVFRFSIAKIIYYLKGKYK